MNLPKIKTKKTAKRISKIILASLALVCIFALVACEIVEIGKESLKR